MRVDRADAMLSLFGRAASPRVTVLLTSAQEMLGRVVRDPTLITAVIADTQPVPGLRAGDPWTWRGAIVARALLGVGPTGDELDSVLLGDRLKGAAVSVAAVIAEGEGAATVLRSMMKGGADVALAAAAALHRVRLGRLTRAIS